MTTGQEKSPEMEIQAEFYEIELGTQMRTIDGKPLVSVRNEKVENEKTGEIEEVELPDKPYRMVEALFACMDNINPDLLSRYFKEVRVLYYECVEFINSGEKSRRVRVNYDLYRALPYIGHASKAIATYLALQLDEAFEPVMDGPMRSPIQMPEKPEGGAKVPAKPKKK